MHDIVFRLQVHANEFMHYENLIWSNHMNDLYDLCVRVKDALEKAKRLRMDAVAVSRDFETMDKSINRSKRRLREQSQSSKEVQKMLEVDIYLKGMINKLFNYGDNIRLVMYPVHSESSKRTTQSLSELEMWRHSNRKCEDTPALLSLVMLPNLLIRRRLKLLDIADVICEIVICCNHNQAFIDVSFIEWYL